MKVKMSSSLSSLRIEGIRSFAPDRAETINFEKPLTIVVGANGTGKTSIVECLKYATTGDMPPGSQKTFVHDPKMAQRSEVRGQVTLQFVDGKKRPVLVERSLKSIAQESKEPKVESLSCVLGLLDANNKETKVTQKIGDMNHAVSKHLGASRAVLNNVAFCHQEDSNWPLSEGKVLKTKFDEIFDATKYIKLQEGLMKHKKEQDKLIAELRGELPHLLDKTNIAAQKKEQLAKGTAEFEKCDEILLSLEKQKRPLEEEVKVLEESIEQAQDLKNEIERKHGGYDEKWSAVKVLKKRTKDKFHGSQSELERVLRDFERKTMEEKGQEERELVLEVERADGEMEEMGRERDGQNRQLAKMELEAEKNSEQITDRDEQVSKLSKELNLSGYSQLPLEDVVVRRFLEVAADSLSRLQKDQEKEEKEYDEEMDRLSRRGNEHRGTIAAKTEFLQNLTKEEAETEDKVTHLERSLRESAGAAKRIKEIVERKRRVEKNLEEKEEEVDEKRMEEEIQQYRAEKAQGREQVLKLHAEMAEVQTDVGRKTRLKLIREGRQKTDKELKEVMDSVRTELRSLFGFCTDGDLSGKVEKMLSDVLVDKSLAESRELEFEKSRSSLDQELKGLNAQIEDTRKKTKENAEDLQAACGGEELEERITELEGSLKDLRSELAVKEGSRAVFDRYTRELNAKSKPCCPLCERGFKKRGEDKALKEKLETSLRSLPAEVDGLKKRIVEKEGDWNQLLALRLIATQQKQLKVKLQDLTKDKETLDGKIAASQRSLDKNTAEKKVCLEKENELRKVEGPVGGMGRLRKELENAERSVAEEEANRPKGLTRSLQVVQDELDRCNKLVDDGDKLIYSKQKRLDAHKKELQSLNLEKNDLFREEVELREKDKEYSVVEGKLKDAKQKLNETTTKIDAARREVAELRLESEQLDKQLTKSKSNKAESWRKWASQLAGINDRLGNIHKLDKEIRVYARAGKGEEYRRCRSTRDQLEEQLETRRGRRDRLANGLESIRVELRQQEARKQELEDCLNVFTSEKELDGLKAELDNLQRKLEDLNEPLMRQKQKAKDKKFRDIQTEMVGQKTRREEKQEKMAQLEAELSGPYKDADVTYQSKLIDKITLEEVQRDIAKYLKALDYAMNKYHEGRMKDINRLLKQLWGRVYRGTDITEIKIVTDEEAGGDSRRRTYNYRVMMKTANQTWLDMRGRCSAGQKVLACILIRVALAEVFCLNCGFMALDEPTTNLDSKNVERMAEGLVELVQERKHQRNFQLLVITHDDKFGDILIKGCQPDHFYSVQKDKAGHSRLDQREDFGSFRYIQD